MQSSLILEWGVFFMSIRIYLYLIIVLLILINPVSAFKVLEPGERMDSSTVIEDDLYVCEDTVSIKGVVLGDVLACGGLVEISGNVTGDVMVGAGNVIINGVVGDDVRVGAGTLIVNGVVGDDLVAGVGTMILADNAKIGGDVVAGSGQMELKGNIGGNITGGAGVVTLSGNVGGDVELDVNELNVLPGANINGNLTYTGPNKAAIPSGAVGKDVLFTERPVREDERFGASSIIWWFIRYLFLLVIALLVLAVFPNRAAAIARSIPENPLKNMAIGFLLAVAVFVGSILLFITVIGIPLGLILLFMTFFVLYAARLFFGLWLGRIIFSRLGRESKSWMDMVVGLFVLFILTSLPWIGFLIYLLVTFVAIGGLFIEEKRFYNELKGKDML
jgi:cytoskeletal protein CcmA (bactofilin family)